jgi:hypothetical protein
MRHVGRDYDAVTGRLGTIAGTGVRGDQETRAAEPLAPPYTRFKRPRWAQTPKPGTDA